MAKTLHVQSNNSGVSSATATCYSLSGRYNGAVEANAQIATRRTGTWSKLAFRTNAIGTGRVFKFRKGGANGSQSASATDTTAGIWEDASNTDTPVAADLINTQITETGTDPTVYWTRMVFDADSGGYATYFCGGSNISMSVTGGASTFASLSGYNDAATEANCKFRFRSAATLKNLFIRASSNTTDGLSSIFIRKNGANGTVTQTINASTTGNFEDTTHTDSIVSGDDVNWSLSNAGTTGNIFIICRSVTAEWTGSTDDGFTGVNAARGAGATVHYFNCLGYNGTTTNTTESQAQVTSPHDITFSKLRCFVSVNTCDAPNCTITFRNNTANGNQVASITASTTGFFEDPTHSDAVTATNPFSLAFTGGTTGSLTLQYIGVAMATAAPPTPVFFTRNEPTINFYRPNIVY